MIHKYKICSINTYIYTYIYIYIQRKSIYHHHVKRVKFSSFHYIHRASLVAQPVKNLPAMWETWVRSLGWEDPLEKGKATHSSILAWRIPWTVQAMGLPRVRHDSATFSFISFHHIHRFIQPSPLSHIRTWLSPPNESPYLERSLPDPSPWQPLFRFCSCGFAYSGCFT